MMEKLILDIRYSLRQLLKNPGYMAVAVLTLALGIGANTAIFSLLRGVLLRPLPFHHGEQLVHVGFRPPENGIEGMRFSVSELGDLRQQSHTFDGFAEYHSMAYTLLGWGEPDRVQTGVVSANFFRELGVTPVLGRDFRAEDEVPGAQPVLLLTHDYWQRRFGGERSIVGKDLQMNGRAITVVGVLPPLPQYPGKDDLYMPTAACPFRSTTRTITSRNSRFLTLLGRVKPGVDVARAQADLTAVAGAIAREHPEAPRKDGNDIGLASVADELTRRFRPTLFVLAGIVLLVLVITCSNVANLLLARLLARQKEMVVRSAVGAGRTRLLRQLLTESTLLGLLGGCLGLAVAYWSLQLLVAFAARFTPRAAEIAIDWPVLAFTLLISLLTGLAFGLVPALQVSRQDLGAALREGSGHATGGLGRHRFRSILVVLQVATSFVLLVAAGLMVRSLRELQHTSGGFDPNNVLSTIISLPFSKYTTPQQSQTFYLTLLDRVAHHAGVVSVAVASDLPLTGETTTPSVQIENRPPAAAGESSPQANAHIASEAYFQTLGIPLLRGRVFAPTDNRQAPLVVIINDAMARKYFPNQEAVGQRFSVASNPTLRTIVGVVGDVKQVDLATEAGPGFYVPFQQLPNSDMRLLVRTVSDPRRLAPEVRAIVHEIDRDQSVGALSTLAEIRSSVLAPTRLTSVLLMLFAGLAFVITVTGLSGVIAFSVSERTHEIGIRMALGARQGEVLRRVLWGALTLVAIGVALGTVSALAFGHVLSSLLYGIAPTDLTTFVLVILLLPAVVVAACMPPAFRATSVDPIVALRA
jgi:putative ABC transport system permease protein